jgi:hypothetical protein
LLVEGLAGQIRVTGSQGEALVVRGRKRVSAFGKRRAEDQAGAIRLELREEVNQIALRSAASDENREEQVRFEIDVEAPAGTRLLLKGPEADFVVEGMHEAVTVGAARSMEFSRVRGPIEVTVQRSRRLAARAVEKGIAVSGSCRVVELERIGGPVSVEGRIFTRIRLSKLDQGARIESEHSRLEVAGLPGEVEMRVRSVSISDAVGPLRLAARGWRTIRVERVAGEVSIGGQRSDLELLPGIGKAGPWSASVERGDIVLSLAPGAAFSLEAETAHGVASHDFGEAIQVHTDGPAATMTGGTGSGPTIRLHTGRGDIAVRKAEPAERERVRMYPFETIKARLPRGQGRCNGCGNALPEEEPNRSRPAGKTETNPLS